MCSQVDFFLLSQYIIKVIVIKAGEVIKAEKVIKANHKQGDIELPPLLIFKHLLINQQWLIYIQFIIMEEDPAFKKLFNKSFILKKYPDIKIPLVKKQQKLLHEGLTTFFLSTIIHLFIYPFDTIKTRLIAKSLVSDISYFQRNKVSNLTIYLGITRGYASILIGNICHLHIGKENILLGAAVQGLIKTWVDMSKINKQMGNEKANLSLMRKSFFPCAIYGILRDAVYRVCYTKFSTYYYNKYLATSQFKDEVKRFNFLFISVIAATIISQPFDVCFVKVASQRQLKFSNLIRIPIQIVKQEGFKKIIIGGLWARLSYTLLSTMILIHGHDWVQESFVDAF